MAEPGFEVQPCYQLNVQPLPCGAGGLTRERFMDSEMHQAAAGKAEGLQQYLVAGWTLRKDDWVLSVNMVYLIQRTAGRDRKVSLTADTSGHTSCSTQQYYSWKKGLTTSCAEPVNQPNLLVRSGHSVPSARPEEGEREWVSNWTAESSVAFLSVK